MDRNELAARIERKTFAAIAADPLLSADAEARAHEQARAAGEAAAERIAFRQAHRRQSAYLRRLQVARHNPEGGS